ncbi:NADPH:quinone oxidoreductase [Frondihabitans sp. PAMC 28766]|uniref:NAD(P)H-quinone oxidoreductase n=1 Tax=Frondihabitans sp. PAMC 28766 TaxID=1795630 RepID=UPI00078D218A|nr:NAD(P)H-quinone oxidoreductase [Frondihabitans sp. PAMC 28766]AMM22193.1 NADPH:quinone oxidoreductase [Frondihabitans sp. PAMC 28766]
MKAILISRSGGPEVLTLGDVPEPTVGPNDVLIDIAAAGINRADVGQRQGTYPPPPGSPEWPGMEVSGTVRAVGAEVAARSDNSGPSVGDEVVALLGGGGYAEQVAVDAGLVLPKPGPTDLVEAAGLPEAAATVWSNVFMLGGLKPGETLLVHGGTSGIGTMAIQVALGLGSRVVATAGSAAKVAFMEGLGARGLNYRDEDFVEVVRHETGGRGADVILDLVGGDYLARNLDALAMEGRIMVIANQSGADSTFALGKLMAKRGRIQGTTIRSRPLPEKVAIMRGVGEHIWPLVESGAVKPVIDEVLPLEKAADAHRRMDAGGHVGKLLLRVRP